MKYRVSEDGSVPVLYCEKLERWLPMEEHVECEFCAGPVYDESGDPVSYLCIYEGETHRFQPDYCDPCEEGRGCPSDPDRVPGGEDDPGAG